MWLNASPVMATVIFAAQLRFEIIVILGLLALMISVVPIFVFGALILRRLRLITNFRILRWLAARFGWGMNVAELSRRLNMPIDELQRHEPTYRVALIPKRGGGQRRLLVPDPQTKALQRRLLRRVLSALRAHDAAFGFERGKSIVDNARPHCQQAVVVRIDVVDFFPSTSAERVEAYFRRIGWNQETARLLTRMTTHEGGLPQGAPTSPRLSNLMNYFLDVQLTRLAVRYRGVYTRYADDITFSFSRDRPRRVRGIIQKTRQILRRKGYKLNRKKLRILRRHQRQTVTGLVVNEHPQLPRQTRRWLRAVRHHVRDGRPSTLTTDQLIGWMAFELMTLEKRQPPPES